MQTARIWNWAKNVEVMFLLKLHLQRNINFSLFLNVCTGRDSSPPHIKSQLSYLNKWAFFLLAALLSHITDTTRTQWWTRAQEHMQVKRVTAGEMRKTHVQHTGAAKNGSTVTSWRERGEWHWMKYSQSIRWKVTTQAISNTDTKTKH